MMGISSDKKRILVLLWHPETAAVSSGGFVRIKEYLRETPPDFIVDALDNYPSIFNQEEVNGDIYCYRTPRFLIYIEKRNLLLGRLLEGIVSFFALAIRGFNLYKKKRYDVVYSPTGDTFTILAAVVLRKLVNPRMVIDSLNIDMPGGTWRRYYAQLRQSGYSILYAISLSGYIYLFRPILIKCFNQADYIVTMSLYLSRKLNQYGLKVPLEVTPPGINFSYFAKLPKQEKIYDGIFIGRHEIAKGVFDLIDMWKIVVESYPTTKLVMIGFCDGTTYNLLMQKIKENNLSQNILLAGELSEQDKIEQVQQSKVYIHLSPTEPTFPCIAILEGFVCGLPLVAYDAPAYQEIEEIHHSKIISLVPVGDYEKAALEIMRYLQLEPAEMEEIGRIAQEYASRFDWKQIADKQFNILRKVAQLNK